jgi:hypothetical protein
MHRDRRLFGWGLIFILIGAVPLAVQAGVLDRQAVSSWLRLWPLLIVAVGISLLLTRTPAAWLGTIFMAVVVGTMVGGLVATGIDRFPSIAGCGGGTATAFPSESGALANGGRMEIEFNCGTLTVGTAAGGSWTLTGTDGDGRTPEVTTAGNAVTIRPMNGPNPFASRGKVAWNVTVPQDPLLDFGVTLNAGEGRLDLATAKVASLNATVNAGSLDATLGETAANNAVNMTVNAGSATLASEATSGTFNLSLNAGSLKVCLPQGSAVRVGWSGALASHDLDAAGLIKVDEHTWTTQAFNEGQAHVELDVSANAGSFDLNFGGSCGAS